MKSVAAFSDLKFRTSWGITVSTALAPYQILNVLIPIAIAANSNVHINFAPGLPCLIRI